MNKKLYWVKRKPLFQDQKKIYLIRLNPWYYIIFEYLEDVAMSVNDNGQIYIAQDVMMDIPFIAQNVGLDVETVTKALDVCETIDLIHRDENGGIRLLEWHDLLGFSQRDEKTERLAEQNRQRVRKHRAKQGAVQEKRDEVQAPAKAQPAITLYQQYWGQVNPAMAKKLTEMTEDWGDDALCAAIDIAREKGKHHMNYIQAVLVNSKGRPARKETAYAAAWEREFNQGLDAILFEAREPGQSGETKAHERSTAGHDRRPEPGAQSTLAPAL